MRPPITRSLALLLRPLLVALLPLGGCALLLPRTATGIGYDTRVVEGDTLYVLRHSITFGPQELPLPESRTGPAIEERADVVAIDLRGNGTAREVRRVPSARFDDRNLFYQPWVIEPVSARPVRLWSSEELRPLLMRAEVVPCEVEKRLTLDLQDPSVVWLKCAKDEVAARFDPPYTRPCVIRYGAEAGRPDDSPSRRRATASSPRFYSVAGSTTSHVLQGDQLLRVEGCDNRMVIEVGRFPRLVGVEAGRVAYEEVGAGAVPDLVVALADGTSRRYTAPPLASDELPYRREGDVLMVPGGRRVIWIRSLNALDFKVQGKRLHVLELADGSRHDFVVKDHQ